MKYGYRVLSGGVTVVGCTAHSTRDYRNVFTWWIQRREEVGPRGVTIERGVAYKQSHWLGTTRTQTLGKEVHYTTAELVYLVATNLGHKRATFKTTCVFFPHVEPQGKRKPRQSQLVASDTAPHMQLHICG